jgi:hypothetical protein
MCSSEKSRFCDAHRHRGFLFSPPVVAIFLVLIAAVPGIAHAQLNVRVAGVGGWQYNSNVYAVQSGLPVPGTNSFHYSDTYYSYGGLFALSETYSQQNWFVNAGLTRFVYDYFTNLTHNEYNLDGGWNWKIGSNWDGRLDISHTRTMVAFTEIVQLEIAFATEQRETAVVGYQLMPEWRLEASGYRRKVDEPLFDEPNLQLVETSGTLAVKYGGPSALQSGISGNFSHGSYTGVSSNPEAIPFFNYDQKSIDLTATYQPSTTTGLGVSGVSTFDGAVGYSDRSSAANSSNVSGLTGHLDYNNQITGKTSARLAVDRAINSYLTNAAAEIDTQVALSANWQATYRITVTPAYTWLYRFLPLQGPDGTDRRDHLQYAALIVNYSPRPWLIIRPYFNYQTRTSNLYGGNFNATVYGVTVTLAWQHPPAT